MQDAETLSSTSQEGPSSVDEPRALWIGDLEPFMDEVFLYRICIAGGCNLSSAKIIKDRQTGMPVGYGFLEFSTHEDARMCFETYSGREFPGAGKIFRLNWASFRTRTGEPTVEFSIFVGDLAPEVTDYMLMTTFNARYRSVKSAKVVMDSASRSSKGYGFVKFSIEQDAKQALEEMQGIVIGGRPVRLSHASHKRTMSPQFPAGMSPMYVVSETTPLEGQSADAGAPPTEDASNTTVFVGGIDPSIDENVLTSYFQPHGHITSIRIPSSNRSCAFLNFETRSQAQKAIQELNGTTIGTSKLRVSWGKVPLRTRTQQPHAHVSSSAPMGVYAYGWQPTAFSNVAPYLSVFYPYAIYNPYYYQQIYQPNNGTMYNSVQEQQAIIDSVTSEFAKKTSLNDENDKYAADHMDSHLFASPANTATPATSVTNTTAAQPASMSATTPITRIIRSAASKAVAVN